MQRFRRLLPAAVAAFALLLFCIGCGGSAEPSSRPEVNIPWGPSKSYYVEHANEVCHTSWLDALDSFQRRYASRRSGAPFDEAAHNIFLPTIQIVFDNISFLGAPVADKDRVEDILTAMQLAVFAGQEQTVASPQQMETVFAKFNRLARSYGLDRCLVQASSFSPS